MLKTLPLQWILAAIPAAAVSGYQAFDFNDSHHVKTIMPSGIAVEEVHIDKRLHVRSLEINGSKYMLFWLEDNASKTVNDVDIDSIFAPFIVENNDSTGFRIGRLKSLSKDRDVIDRQTGIVDALQYAGKKEGIFIFRNALGGVEANQSVEKGNYIIRYGKQLSRGRTRNDIEYIDTTVSITPDENTTWLGAWMNELIKVDVPVLKSMMFDRRRMQLTRNIAALPPHHWFMRLGADIRTWPFGRMKKESRMSLREASKLFRKKEREILSIANDREKKAAWVRENMDFLSHLDTLLENHALDDRVSQTLFAILGYVDTAESSTILSKVLLNEKINDKERFRSMMGLKNTSAPIDEETLDTLISYGLSVDGSSMLQRGAGMLLGALAHQRAQRVPSQTEKIGEAIVNAIDTGDDKVVALNAAANMKSAAPKAVVRSVEETLMGDPNLLNRQKSAQALERIQKSDLTVSAFETLYENEKDTATKAAIIRSSIAASDFQNNETYHEFLLDIAKTHSEPTPNKMAALEVLEKRGFGKTANEKKALRQMMVGVKNEQIMKELLKLYRK
ncbi:MAG: hypothetical protein B5M52_04485 [Helicobacteraceae bacterium 4484_230]|nr:MAG: hypothetical protein B5M52_04485 [Helicobacteraceae bacterium 4484_230]